MDEFQQRLLAAQERVGIRRDDKPRPVLIKLREHCDKDKIWLPKSGLKGTGITISEFLTKTRHYLFMAARRHFGISVGPGMATYMLLGLTVTSPKLKSRTRKIAKN
ncbi:unnamed protein product [Pieris macdunnoughi]|uniref:Uncharacterized protein n=1 Tax=Pieris macdunnoughi TaxID=345717 RepID=A0A821PC61_9NEOP|nr:unnamed protein product [Pieris macdunnoughi]